MGKRLDGKVAIVTGGALGLGKATATRMAEEGAAVAVLDILDKEGAALARELSERQLRAHYWHCDVTREVDVARVVGEVVAEFGRLDVLVNNAGIGGASKPTHEITEEEWDLVQAINVKGPFFFTKHCVPHMKTASGGSIINISSIYGLVGAADAPPYHASKGAIRLMAKTDAMIYAPDRIRVNSVHPGFIRTPLVENGLAQTEDAAAILKELEARHPLGHIGEPDDIAWGIVYLASDEAKFVTGSELVIDGGYTAH
jgi:NAD(P)-dependent dehydrogenase (short-subunit alcohol dehydrogenase family)